MAETEEYFPRGGKKPTTTYFKQSGNFLGAAEKGERKKKKQKKKSEDDDGYLSDEVITDSVMSHRNCASRLNYKSIKPGVLVLGRVFKVYETKLGINLPGAMVGMVMACHISEAYNKLLEAYVNDQTEKIKELREMFYPGQYVAVKVLEVDGRKLMLSMMPQHVNAGRTHTDINKGDIYQAAVSSVEDHGYLMDIGIPNTRPFLPKKNVNPDIELDTGVSTWVCVKSVTPSPDSSVVQLSSEVAALQNARPRRASNLPLLPATPLYFVVDQPLDNGIEGHVFEDTRAYIQRPHVDKVKGKKPALGQKIKARVLYVVPIRNTPFLTMKEVFPAERPALSAEQLLPEGHIVEEAQVVRILGRNVVFALGGGCTAVMNSKTIAVDLDLADEQVLAKSYPIGSKHRVRVLKYNPSDFGYLVTDQPAVLQQKYFSLDQLQTGDTVDATVHIIAENHMIVNVDRLHGYIQRIHYSDAGVIQDPKLTQKRSKKFRVGQQLRARVLHVDREKQSLVLTLKPSLMADFEVLASYEQALVGKAYTGFIRGIRDFIIVAFFNNVTAYVPRNYVTREPIENISEAFHLGQIVSCTIIKVDLERRHITGSLTTTPFWQQPKRENKGKRKNTDETDPIPHKKQKNDDEDTQKHERKKKTKKSEDTEQVSEEHIDSENESEDTKRPKKKKKNKKSDHTDEVSEEPTKKKRKNSKANEDDEIIEDDKQVKRKNKKDQKPNTDIEEDDSKDDLEDEEPKQELRRSKRKIAEVNKSSEENDETDIHEVSDNVLTPQEQVLVDLSECNSIKFCNKRIKSLKKNVNARYRRIYRIEDKILRIENKGLNTENKKFHTAMHAEILVIEERIKKLIEALRKVEGKLEELNLAVLLERKQKKAEKKLNKKKKKEMKQQQDIVSVAGLDSVLEVPSVKDFWSAKVEPVTNAVENESSSSGDEEQEQPKKKRKKLTVAEKLAKVREEEERVREMEKRAIESESQPRSSEQFERALLANPDCSQLWIAYMAFHLQSTELDKARAVGRRALRTISFREEQEKLNLWLALLNCEIRFGTKESQQKTLEEALQMNEPYEVHTKLLDMYVETSKLAELGALVDLMLRKYKRPQAYIAAGAACFKAGMKEKARQVMQKAISVLQKREHVFVLVQFALLERAAGERERAEALFEQVLAVYPQRVDVCAAYLDMLRKGGDLHHIRQVMERMTAQKLPARKMKTLYKKWIEVEEKIGDEDKVEEIKKRAMEYIDNAKF